VEVCPQLLVQAPEDEKGPTQVLQANKGEQADVLAQLVAIPDSGELRIRGHSIAVTNLNKALWPATEDCRDLTKRDLLNDLARTSTFLLFHSERLNKSASVE